MATTVASVLRRSVLLASCVFTSVSGTAWADSYVYITTKDFNFGVLDLTTGGYALCGNSGLLLAGLANKGKHVWGAAYQGSAFYKVNPANGGLTLVGNASIDFYGLGSTKLGVYALDSNGNLYTVNTTTGATTEIGSTGLVLEPNTYGLSVGSGKLYMADNGTLYSLNTETGAPLSIRSGEQPFGALVYTDKVLYGGADTNPTTVWSLIKRTGKETMISTVQGENSPFWGLTPTPTGSTGTCPK